MDNEDINDTLERVIFAVDSLLEEIHEINAKLDAILAQSASGPVTINQVFGDKLDPLASAA